MKITGIAIGEYRQFKDIKFDFTYPANHAKAGQPLDKVCFIGQSGTGKTTLLNVIWELSSTLSNVANAHDQKVDLVSYPDNFLPEIIRQSSYSINLDGALVHFNRLSEIYKSDRDFLNDWFSTKLTTTQQYKIIDTDKVGIYIKDSIAREADAFLFNQQLEPQIFSDFVKTDTQVEKEKLTRDEHITASGAKKVISLGDMQSLSTWQYLLKDIDDYDEETVQKITKIIQNASKSEVTDELQKWIAADPRMELAEKCINPILDKLFLEVNVSVKGNAPITLRTKQGTNINSSHLSTGTRQLLATSIPIYKFDTTDTVILFDEPERSLFPDIQRIIVDYYTSLAPQAQFFFATHSPIIASAFEPCERFILDFDENGEVNCHTGVAPEGDDPNDILSEDFGLKELMLPKGLEEYERYRQLAMRIREETDEDKKNELIIQRLELGNRYNF